MGLELLAAFYVGRRCRTSTIKAVADETVMAGATVLLDGRASTDPDGRIVRYAWAQTEGSPVSLSGADTATSSFSAPALEHTSVLGFTLTVTDDSGEEAQDSVRITVLGNAAPTADAGPDQTVRGAAVVALDGTASNDADGHINSYAWQQTAGTPVTLSGADTATPSFTAPRLPEAQVLSFELTVTDNSASPPPPRCTSPSSATIPRAPRRESIKRYAPEASSS